MSTIKTLVTGQDPLEFISNLSDQKKKEEGLILLKLFKKVTGEKPKMWGTSIIGFGKYHYKSERSKQEGDWSLTGFSPRKQALTLYITFGFPDDKKLLKELGKHKTGMGCLYINKLSDVNLDILEEIIKRAFIYNKSLHQE